MTARLLAWRNLGANARHFVFEVPELEVLTYEPGQFVSFTSTVTGRQVTRAYSIASAPEGNRFELCLNRVEDGVFSPFLFSLLPGDEVPVAGPLGYFVPRVPFRDSLLIATGTGIAPFRSYLRTPRIIGSDAQITLLFGARMEDGLLYREEFEKLELDRPGLRFIPTLTRPEPSWTGRTGRVQVHLEEALGGRKDVDIYLCGLKSMVDEIRQLLKARGFDRKQILYEKYD